MDHKGSLFRKYMALLLALLVSFSFMPLLTDSVYAEASGDGEAEQMEAASEEGYSDIGQEADDNVDQGGSLQAGLGQLPMEELMLHMHRHPETCQKRIFLK